MAKRRKMSRNINYVLGLLFLLILSACGLQNKHLIIIDNESALVGDKEFDRATLQVARQLQPLEGVEVSELPTQQSGAMAQHAVPEYSGIGSQGILPPISSFIYYINLSSEFIE
jgi:hypothetical protein